MDFAALVAKEISKAKDSNAPKSSSPERSQDTEEPPKKYMRRGETEAARVAAYQEEQELLQQEREERMAHKRKLEEEEAERRRERDEKKRRLAEESKKRREEEEAAKERERRRKLGLPELPAKSDGDESTPAAEEVVLQKMWDGPIPTTLEPVPGGQMIIPAKIPKDQEGRLFLFRQLASYFNMVLSEWELGLAKRDVSDRQSFKGRQAYNAMVQSRENMEPLFRRFEKADLEDALLEPIVEIVHKAQQRRYVDANDAYLRVSIGKAYVQTFFLNVG